jgi:hypothetical protein
MSRRTARTAVVAATTGLMLVTGVGAAFANDSVNVSRSTKATPGGSSISTPFGDLQVKGHWINIGEGWLFVSPGTESLLGGAVDTSGLPGAEGNFSGANEQDALLGVQGTKGGKACERDSFGQHGIASACGMDEGH